MLKKPLEDQKDRVIDTLPNIDLAVEAITTGRLSYREAELEYGVPRTTLSHRVHGLHSGPIGQPYKLPEAIEQELAVLIHSYCRKGNVLETSFFCELARKHVARVRYGIKFEAHRDW